MARMGLDQAAVDAEDREATEPPNVNVPAPVVNVEPAPVHVELPEFRVSLPVCETLSEITRDFHGDIVKVVQTERALPESMGQVNLSQLIR